MQGGLFERNIANVASNFRWTHLKPTLIVIVSMLACYPHILTVIFIPLGKGPGKKNPEKLCPFDKPGGRGEQERLFGSREREGKLKITFPFYGKGTGIRKLLREGKFEACIPGNHGKREFLLTPDLFT